MRRVGECRGSHEEGGGGEGEGGGEGRRGGGGSYLRNNKSRAPAVAASGALPAPTLSAPAKLSAGVCGGEEVRGRGGAPTPSSPLPNCLGSSCADRRACSAGPGQRGWPGRAGS